VKEINTNANDKEPKLGTKAQYWCDFSVEIRGESLDPPGYEPDSNLVYVSDGMEVIRTRREQLLVTLPTLKNRN
jgi:hypothetical protein